MNQINPKKLLNSKWTAVTPENKEKHFLISKLEFDDDNKVTLCEIEAVHSNRAQAIDRRELKDSSEWRQGGK